MKAVLIKPFSVVHRRSRHLLADVPSDLFGVACFVTLAVVLLAVVDVSSPVVRTAVGAPLLFLVPGYVTVSVLFPRAEPVREPADAGRFTQAREVTDVERAALSFGVSLALLPLLAVSLSITPWGYSSPAIVGFVAGFALIGTVFAVLRRLSVPAPDRYRVRFDRRIDAVHGALFDTGSSIHTAVNVVLVCSILLALTTTGYALVAPQQGEEYTSLQLLSEDDSGDLVASGYPEAIEPGESIPLVITLENQEGQHTNYTVVVQEQHVEDGEVVERTELRTIDYLLSDGATGHGDREFTPTAEEGDVRISVQVYLDEPPAEPTHDDAYRYAYFWTEVSEDGGAE